MQEVFYEESAYIQNTKSASFKFNVIKILSVLSYVALSIWLFICIFYPFAKENVLLQIVLLLIPALLFLGSGILLGKLKNRFYVEYDYTFVTGSIRFSKVIKNTKRKFIVKFECSDIEKIGKVGSDTFDKYYRMPGTTCKTLTSNSYPADKKDFYYIVANIKGDKNIFILECTETFMVNVLKFSNKLILEEDFKK